MREPEELLPSGSAVDLEMYQCVIRQDDEELEYIVVTCDHLRLMLVVPKDAVYNTLIAHNIQPHSEEAYHELAEAFQRQCNTEDSKLWPLQWSKLLDRKLFALVQLQTI